MEKALKFIKDLKWLQKDIIGRNMLFKTPFGKKPLVYADYTASGRCLYSIEKYLNEIMKYYANSHTDDDFTGKTTTNLLHQAEKKIKKAVNAGKTGKIIFTESGTTGGITKLQEILGVYWSPATKDRVNNYLESCSIRYPKRGKCSEQLNKYIDDKKPIVFVSPYEHHSNEIMWRQTLCDIIEIPLNSDHVIDLDALKKIVSDEKYKNRQKIGSFSAASNVSGLKTPIYKIAKILHENNALACFDFAACAPYVEIDMNKDSESYFDAIFLSPHKFLGGPGSSGLLIFNEKIYRKDLPPTIAAGGTVDYVSPEKEEFIDDIETREKPGTPGIIQALKTSLVFQLKDKIGVKKIESIEEYYYKKFKNQLSDSKKIQFYGPQSINLKIPIIPFNITYKEKVLHPKFVTKLFNDLFGIQTRAGCSCAGPYGHYLMGINQLTSNYYRCMITNAGYHGIKPGWVRLNLHYILTIEEFDYIVEALKFIEKFGHRFISLYDFDIKTGEWNYSNWHEEDMLELNIDDAINSSYQKNKILKRPAKNYKKNIKEAYKIAQKLEDSFEEFEFEKEMVNVIFFPAKNVLNYND